MLPIIIKSTKFQISNLKNHTHTICKTDLIQLIYFFTNNYFYKYLLIPRTKILNIIKIAI